MRAGLLENLLLLYLLWICFNGNQTFKFKMTNLGCESFNKSWVVYTECRLRAISRNKTTMTAFVMVSEPAYNIFVRARVLRKANGYKPWIIDYTIDACKFMRNRHHPFAKIIWKLIRDVSTINHSCPYNGLNGLKDFYDVSTMPLILPSGEYLLNLTWIFDKKPQFVTNVYFSYWDD
ncbi:uncharacterized protein LOC133836424 [Drosophila sulfurigaster albostrigata]|uniref:uncharacterized protein LOC133836424 n=1 Tax=Drosophila sulfurigaster albostrigata TaxID=89887 RepID=UPI002D21ED71|nr:uncharacterized protein LOC133836424 [Drosophila sulfurigaster albostrigata]